MKILIYGINYAPELTGIGKYSAELAEWMAAHGHEVSVLTAPPYYPQWQVHDGYRAGRYRKEERAGVTVRRAPLWLRSVQSAVTAASGRQPAGPHPCGGTRLVLRARRLADRPPVRRPRVAAHPGLRSRRGVRAGPAQGRRFARPGQARRTVADAPLRPRVDDLAPHAGPGAGQRRGA
ncbi:hypothetical protein G6F22_017104 [Rhizopus arrhizus]|nr:hypothetical protein G6F22_017104 [Rhizopus arrhizus]